MFSMQSNGSYLLVGFSDVWLVEVTCGWLQWRMDTTSKVGRLAVTCVVTKVSGWF